MLGFLIIFLNFCQYCLWFLCCSVLVLLVVCFVFVLFFGGICLFIVFSFDVVYDSFCL